MDLERLRDRLHAGSERLLAPLTRGLARLGVEPNQITVVGALASVAAAALIVAGELVWAGVIWLVASSLDLLDGAMARQQNRVTGFGALLDSTLDRVSEGVVFAAIAYHFAAQGDPITTGLAVLALLGSVLVSYTRARAETLGARCRVGLTTRPERVLLLAVGLCANLLELVIQLLVVLTAFTVVQRVRAALRALAPRGQAPSASLEESE